MSLSDRVKRIARPLKRKILRATRRPRVGRVNFGDLRRLQPISKSWGFDRGAAVDRYYIERFLRAHRDDVAGRVLEVSNNDYTRVFGGARVSRSDVLDIRADNPDATIVADLAKPQALPAAAFDCVICTQTLQLIYELEEAVRTLHHTLRPGGCALVTVPQISRLDPYAASRGGDHWRLTSAAAKRLFSACFDAGAVSVHAYGNVLAATAFLHGLSADELSQAELDYFDPHYEMIVGVRAVK